MTAITLVDDGYLELTLEPSGPDAGCCPVTQKVDLYATFNTLADLSRRHDDTTAWLHAVAEHLESLGFPRVSHRLASRVWEAVSAAVESRKKADAGSPTAG